MGLTQQPATQEKLLKQAITFTCLFSPRSKRASTSLLSQPSKNTSPERVSKTVTVGLPCAFILKPSLVSLALLRVASTPLTASKRPASRLKLTYGLAKIACKTARNGSTWTPSRTLKVLSVSCDETTSVTFTVRRRYKA